MILSPPRALDYFEKIASLLSGTLATDREGQKLDLDQAIQAAGELIVEVKAAARKVIALGNGGSAAIASHMHNDLCKALGIRALVFNEAPLLTAHSNDHGYPTAFNSITRLWVESGDVCVAISSSGRSENILSAVESANTAGAQSITLSGFTSNNPLRSLGTFNFYVAAEHYGLVESCHQVLTHLLTDTALARLQG